MRIERFLRTKVPFWMYLLLFSFLLSACTPGIAPFQDKPFPNMSIFEEQTPRISGFLSLRSPAGPSVRMEIVNVEVFAGDIWLPLSEEVILLDSEEIADNQVFIGSRVFSTGNYQNFRFTVHSSEVRNAEGTYIPTSREPFVVEVALAEDLVLEEGDSKTLLITWDVENSLTPENEIQPVFVVSPPLRQLPNDLIFVACPNIDTVFIVRADKNWVYDSFGVKGGPTYIALGRNGSNLKIYVLCAREETIKVVDFSTYRIIDFFPAPLNDSPTFMILAPDERHAFLLDKEDGYLTRLDLLTGAARSRVQLNFGPQYMTYLEGYDLVAVSLSLSQEVLLVDPRNLNIVRRYPSGNSPSGLFLFEGQLYIAETGGNSILVVDLDENSQNRILVGTGPKTIQGSENQIYVSNFIEGSLSVLMPNQLGIIQQIYGLKKPREMVFNEFYRRIYVADQKDMSLGVIQTNSNSLSGRIELGAQPLGLAVLQ